MSTTAASAPSTSPVPGLSPGAGNHAGHARAHRAERTGIDRHLSRRFTDTLTVPVDPGIAAVLARYPLPNYAAGPSGAHLRNRLEGGHRRRPVFLRIDHKFSAKDQFFARFNLDNLTGPTTNPDQTAIDPAFGIQYIDRQRNVVGTYTRTVSPRLTSSPPSASPAPRRAFPPPTTPTPRSSSTTAL
jgi:hypothetical protein